MKNLIGKTAVVTGASRGIGVYIVDKLTKKGVNVIGIARTEEGLKKAAEKVKQNQGLFEYYKFDLSVTDNLVEGFNKLKNHSIDFLINNAGIEIYKEYEKLTFSEIEKIVKVNLLSPMELTRLLLPQIKENKGNIINIASLAGKKGVIYNGIYSATKAGMILWSDALSQELMPQGVGVTAICPGYISETGMFNDGGYPPPKLLGESSPNEVANAIIIGIIKNKKEIIINSGPIRPLLALAQISPKISDIIINWFGVPKLSWKRAFEPKGKNRI